MIEEGALEESRRERYAGWRKAFGKRILKGEESLVSLEDHVLMSREPTPTSGRQELLENTVARYIDQTR